MHWFECAGPPDYYNFSANISHVPIQINLLIVVTKFINCLADAMYCVLAGTVRAYDMVRYRNFKTLTSPQATQFSCLAVDSSGELVAAGGQDSHQIYLWSLKMGIFLDVRALNMALHVIWLAF